MLTKKDFKRVADILNRSIKYGFTKESLTERFIEWFKSENYKFDEDKFKEAVFKE